MDGHQKFTDEFEEDRAWSGNEEEASPSPDANRKGNLQDDSASVASAGGEADIDMSNVSGVVHDAININS
jgi:hypothetical protein